MCKGDSHEPTEMDLFTCDAITLIRHYKNVDVATNFSRRRSAAESIVKSDEVYAAEEGPRTAAAEVPFTSAAAAAAREPFPVIQSERDTWWAHPAQSQGQSWQMQSVRSENDMQGPQGNNSENDEWQLRPVQAESDMLRPNSGQFHDDMQRHCSAHLKSNTWRSHSGQSETAKWQPPESIKTILNDELKGTLEQKRQLEMECNELGLRCGELAMENADLALRFSKLAARASKAEQRARVAEGQRDAAMLAHRLQQAASADLEDSLARRDHEAELLCREIADLAGALAAEHVQKQAERARAQLAGREALRMQDEILTLRAALDHHQQQQQQEEEEEDTSNGHGGGSVAGREGEEGGKEDDISVARGLTRVDQG
eukprot:jgi/Mesen1/8034/ME000428S07239